MFKSLSFTGKYKAFRCSSSDVSGTLILSCLLRADEALEEAKRDGRLVGLQFLFGAAAEVVPVEGAPKVVAVL